MRQRPRSPILNLLQLAIFGYIFWQVRGTISGSSSDAPAMTIGNAFETIGLIFIGITAITLLNIIYPLLAWGIEKLRERQATWSPEERFEVVESSDTELTPSSRHCPGCGASLFDDAPTCPWCGHQLVPTSAPH